MVACNGAAEPTDLQCNFGSVFTAIIAHWLQGEPADLALECVVVVAHAHDAICHLLVDLSSLPIFTAKHQPHCCLVVRELEVVLYEPALTAAALSCMSPNTYLEANETHTASFDSCSLQARTLAH